jgi:hypothetical protein
MSPEPGLRDRVAVPRAAVREWLASRRPEPPPALAARLAHWLDALPDAAFVGGTLAAVLGELGLVTLRAALAAPAATARAGPGAPRPPLADEAALDLLAADAFVTYAFEAASEGSDDVPALARRLLAEIAT